MIPLGDLGFSPLKLECLQPLICGNQPLTTKITGQSCEASDLNFLEQPLKSKMSSHSMYSTNNCLAMPEHCDDAIHNSPGICGQEVDPLVHVEVVEEEEGREMSEKRDYVFDGYEAKKRRRRRGRGKREIRVAM